MENLKDKTPKITPAVRPCLRFYGCKIILWTGPLTEYEAKLIVKDYLSKGGFTANDIDTRNQPEGLNIPDLEVDDGTTTVAYCEVKTPEHKLNPQTRMYQWNTTINKLRALSRKDIAQVTHLINKDSKLLAETEVISKKLPTGTKP